MRSPQRELRVLYVEDSEMDRALVRAAVERGPQIRVTVAANYAEMKERLKEETYDLFLADLNLPDVDGLELVAELRDQLPEVPVVVLTGTGSEQTAVTAMKRGATDYIIKSGEQFRQLPRVILAAVDDQRLRVDWEHFFNVSRDLLAVVDFGCRILSANPTFAHFVGHVRDEMLDAPLTSFIDADDVSRFEQYWSNYWARESDDQDAGLITVNCVTADGNRPVEWRAFLSRGSNHMFLVGHDVTQRRLEEERARQREAACEKLEVLSKREREVLELVAAGHPNKQVAHQLGLSTKTIEKHRSNGMRKLGLENVPELVHLLLACR